MPWDTTIAPASEKRGALEGGTSQTHGNAVRPTRLTTDPGCATMCSSLLWSSSNKALQELSEIGAYTVDWPLMSTTEPSLSYSRVSTSTSTVVGPDGVRRTTTTRTVRHADGRVETTRTATEDRDRLEDSRPRRGNTSMRRIGNSRF